MTFCCCCKTRASSSAPYSVAQQHRSGYGPHGDYLPSTGHPSTHPPRAVPPHKGGGGGGLWHNRLSKQFHYSMSCFVTLQQSSFLDSKHGRTLQPGKHGNNCGDGKGLYQKLITSCRAKKDGHVQFHTCMWALIGLVACGWGLGLANPTLPHSALATTKRKHGSAPAPRPPLRSCLSATQNSPQNLDEEHKVNIGIRIA